MDQDAQLPGTPAPSWRRHGRQPLAALTRREPLRAWSPTTTDLPWGDPAFSERMLAEHLDQGHDLASRRLAVVEQQVEWLVERLGTRGGRPRSRPRLRSRALRGGARTPRRRRHRRRRRAGRRARGTCALRRSSVLVRLLRHAHDRARGRLLRRRADPLRAAGRATARGGRAAAPPHRVSAHGDGATRPRGRGRVDARSREHLAWWTGRDDLWGEGEHLVLHERDWDEDAEALVDRYHVVDAATGRVEVYGVSEAACPPARLATVLEATGFSPPTMHRAWDGIAPETLGGMVVAVSEPAG